MHLKIKDETKKPAATITSRWKMTSCHICIYFSILVNMETERKKTTIDVKKNRSTQYFSESYSSSLKYRENVLHASNISSLRVAAARILSVWHHFLCFFSSPPCDLSLSLCFFFHWWLLKTWCSSRMAHSIATTSEKTQSPIIMKMSHLHTLFSSYSFAMRRLNGSPRAWGKKREKKITHKLQQLKQNKNTE